MCALPNRTMLYGVSSPVRQAAVVGQHICRAVQLLEPWTENF